MAPRRHVASGSPYEGPVGGGADPSPVVRTRTYLVDAADAEAVGRVHGQLMGAVRPAATMVVVAGLLDPRWRVELEVEAVVTL